MCSAFINKKKIKIIHGLINTAYSNIYCSENLKLEFLSKESKLVAFINSTMFLLKRKKKNKFSLSKIVPCTNEGVDILQFVSCPRRYSSLNNIQSAVQVE